MTKIGDSYSTTCDSSDCFGSMTGIFGGKFYVGERAIEYSQILNCKCDRCGLEKAELFEVWDDQQEEFCVSSLVTIPISDDSDISFPGLGMRADCIPPDLEYFLRTGIKTN
jgi:hypothetical protein